MDDPIRMHAFHWLAERALQNDYVFSRNDLENGFSFQGNRITLVGPRGIWKPKVMTLPISITSTNDGTYEDSTPEGDFFNYKYRGTDPFHADNAGLREMMKRKIPLIYFFKIAKSEYIAHWPVFIQEDNMENLEFSVAMEDRSFIGTHRVEDITAEYGRRAYLTSKVKIRLHQRTFREKVLRAYASQCSLCALRHKELLDAAHIVPDSEEWGRPIIQNGLSLCKIHHAAFDNHIIGIDPDYTIHVRTDILQEIDGPMLKHGIQQMDRQKLILPRSKTDWPDRERLDYRYEKFRRVG